jgi:hypothetical protein
VVDWSTIALPALVGLAPAEPVEPERVSPSGVELHWHAPPSCPTEADVAASIAARLDEGTPTREPVVADIVVAKDGDSHVAELVIAASSGRTIRRLEATECDTVADAAALIVAMVHAQVQSSAPVADPVPPSPEPPAERVASPPPSEPAPKRSSRLRGGAFAEIGIGFGGLPRVGPGLGGGLALMGRWFRAEIVGTFWFAREASIGIEGEGARVDVRLWTVGVHAGPLVRVGPIELALLVGGHAGLAHGEGDRLPIVRSARRPWVSVGAYPAVLWPLHPRVALGLRGTVEGVPLRPRFAVREGGTRFTASPVAGALSAVVEVRFP